MKSSRRAVRRHHKDRMKEKIKKRIRRNFGDLFLPGEEIEGRLPGIHSTTRCMCSAACCGNPRKYYNSETLQEVKNRIKFEEELDEVN